MSYALDIPRTGEARKAVILVRVSSREQEEGYSIDAQKHRLENYCARRDIEVLKTFEIVESSTRGDRNKFMELVKFAGSQKQVVAIVADKVDRVQRSFREYPLLDDLIQRGKIELHFNTENYVIHKGSMSQERLMWSMGVIMAQSYVDSMKDNGYLNKRDEHDRSIIVIDTERAPLVIKLFQEYATGLYMLSQMVEKAKAWGLRNNSKQKSVIQRSHIYSLLNNPFYYGEMKIKGEIHSHRYEPIISKQLFDDCQAVMKGWNKKPFQYAGKEFVFRGLITCATTGRVVTASEQKRTYKNGEKASWTYLRAWNPDNPEKLVWVREEKVLAQIEAAFDSLYISQEKLEAITDYVRDTDKTERDFLRRQTGELKKDYAAVQNRLDGLMDLPLDGAINKEEFSRKKSSLRDQQATIRAQMAAHEAGDDKFKDSLIALLELSAGAGASFRRSTIEKKRRLAGFLFANLQLKGPTLCYELKKPFCWFPQCDDLVKWSG